MLRVFGVGRQGERYQLGGSTALTPGSLSVLRLRVLLAAKGQQAFSVVLADRLCEVSYSVGNILCSQHLRKSLAFGRCLVNISRSNDCLLIHRPLCWLGYCFSTRLSHLLFHYIWLLMLSGHHGNPERGQCVSPPRQPVSWWREGGNSIEEENLSGSGMQVIELENQVSVEDVIRISSDAEHFLTVCLTKHMCSLVLILLNSPWGPSAHSLTHLLGALWLKEKSM